MKHLCRTTAIALAMGGLAIGTAGAASNNDNANANNSGSQQMVSTNISDAFCQKPWSKIDADDNGYVSKKEAQDAAKTQFKAMDSNGDGKISQQEYNNCMNAFGSEKSAMTDRSADNFKSADANQDKQVDRTEYRDMAKQSYQAMQDAEGSSDANAQPFVILRRYVWLTPDQAKDANGMKNMSQDEAAARSAINFSALDKNGDNKLSSDEWAQGTVSTKRDQKSASAEFNKMDKDGSGSIDESEYQSAQADKVDQTTTASTNKSNDDSNVQEEAAVTDQAEDHEATGAMGTPVYVYRFMTY